MPKPVSIASKYWNGTKISIVVGQQLIGPLVACRKLNSNLAHIVMYCLLRYLMIESSLLVSSFHAITVVSLKYTYRMWFNALKAHNTTASDWMCYTLTILPHVIDFATSSQYHRMWFNVLHAHKPAHVSITAASDCTNALAICAAWYAGKTI